MAEERKNHDENIKEAQIAADERGRVPRGVRIQTESHRQSSGPAGDPQSARNPGEIGTYLSRIKTTGGIQAFRISPSILLDYL